MVGIIEEIKVDTGKNHPFPGNEMVLEETEPTNPSPYLTELRRKHVESVHGKFIDALEAFEKDLKKPILIPDEEKIGQIRALDSSLSLKALFELKQMGLLSNVMGTDVGSTTRIVKDGMEVSIDRFAIRDVGLSFGRYDNHLRVAEETRQQFENSKIKKAFNEVIAALQGYELSVESSEFTIGDDDLFPLSAMLGNLGFFGDRYTPKLDDLDKDSSATLESEIIRIIAEAQTNEHNEIKIVLNNESLWKADLKASLVLTLDDDWQSNLRGRVKWRVCLEKDILTAVKEKANQSPESRADHLLYRGFGAELVKAFEEAGLKFSDEFATFVIENRVVANFDDRYGGAYTQISRNIAKFIWTNEIKNLAEVFVPKDGQALSVQDLEKLVNVKTENAGLRELLNLLSQAIEKRDSNAERGLPPSGTAIKLREGACFDVVGYYCDAARSGKVFSVLLKNPEPVGEEESYYTFLSKSSGARTLLAAEPALVGGIQYPEGSLFIVAGDGNLAFLRLTPFNSSWSPKEMRDAFGTEMVKAQRDGIDDPEAWVLIKMRQAKALAKNGDTFY